MFIAVDECYEDAQFLLDILSDDNEPQSSENINSRDVKVIRKPKHVNKKRRINVVVDNGVVVSFEAGFPRPRVMKTDIRRSYANMYVNMMNANDFPTLFGFFDTFCSPSFSHGVTRLMPDSQTFTITRNGVNESAKFYCYNLVTIPDSTIFLKNADVITSDDGSRIVAKYTCKSTKIFDRSSLFFDQMCSTTDEFDSENKLSLISRIRQEVDANVSSLPLRPTPVSVMLEGYFTIYVDEDKRITKMEMISRAV